MPEMDGICIRAAYKAYIDVSLPTQPSTCASDNKSLRDVWRGDLRQRQTPHFCFFSGSCGAALYFRLHPLIPSATAVSYTKSSTKYNSGSSQYSSACIHLAIPYQALPSDAQSQAISVILPNGRPSIGTEEVT